MLKFPKPEEYYKLYENPVKKKEYEKLLKNLSNKTTSRDYFKESAGKIYSKKNELHKDIFRSILDGYKSSNRPLIYFWFITLKLYMILAQPLKLYRKSIL